jgi:membrane protease YdiL (CAAX protease family)
MRRGSALIFAAATAALFVPLFALRRLGPLDFWWWMSLNVALLVALGTALDRGYLPALRDDLRTRRARKIALGVLSAAALYAVFWAGNEISRRLLPFAGPGIESVYGLKSGAPRMQIVLLLALWIGPGEELVWRAWLQRRAVEGLGARRGLLAAAALYALVHAASGNPMLVLAAAVCGLFWGVIYLKTRSVLLVAVSHTLWDLAVFILVPFR